MPVFMFGFYCDYSEPGSCVMEKTIYDAMNMNNVDRVECLPIWAESILSFK
jgi:hypothetical protein